MKITKQQLKQIIKEELTQVFEEQEEVVAELPPYKSTAPFRKSETHRPMGAVVTDDFQNRSIGIKGPEGYEIYEVGEHVPGLGLIEDIDENGDVTILPDDLNEPAYRLGHSDSTSQEKADAAEEARNLERWSSHVEMSPEQRNQYYIEDPRDLSGWAPSRVPERMHDIQLMDIDTSDISDLPEAGED